MEWDENGEQFFAGGSPLKGWDCLPQECHFKL